MKTPFLFYKFVVTVVAAMASLSAHAQTLTAISVTPTKPTLVIGSNLQFTATGTYSDSSTRVLTGSAANWTMLAPLPLARSGVGCASVNGQLYVAGGGEGSEVFAYDPSANSWTSKAPFGNRLAYPGAAGIGNKLYLIGGCEGSDCRIGTLAELGVYDAVANSWSNAASMSVARSSMAVGVINGKIYAAGGLGACPPCVGYNLLEVYDPSSNTWTAKTPMPTVRYAMGGAVIGGKLYVAGGGNDTTPYLGTLEVYDPITDAWATKVSMPTPRQGLGVTAVGNLLYAINGTTAAGTTNLVEV